MTTKCDYCRKPLGLCAHRYWRMQYCSVECVAAYRRRLAEATIGKILILESRRGDSRVRAKVGVEEEAA
jgi:hypothetical protein